MYIVIMYMDNFFESYRLPTLTRQQIQVQK